MPGVQEHQPVKVATNKLLGGSKKIRITTFEIKHYAQIPHVADHVLNQHCAILNLSNIVEDDFYHVIDFISGLSYATHSTFKKIAPKIYVIGPNQFDITKIQHLLPTTK